MSLNTADKDRIEARREQVAALRLRGHSERKIATMLGVSVGTVCLDLKELGRRWREASAGDIADLRARQLAEYAEVKAAGWEADDLDVVIKAMVAEAKLLGLDAPVKTESNDTVRILVD